MAHVLGLCPSNVFRQGKVPDPKSGPRSSSSCRELSTVGETVSAGETVSEGYTAARLEEPADISGILAGSRPTSPAAETE